MTFLKDRRFINTLLALAGYLVLVTGVCLFFDFNYVGIDDIHEISGLTLGAVAILHVIVNWRALLKTIGPFASPRIALAVAAGTVVGLICFWQFGIYQPDPNDVLDIAAMLP